jgi:GMP synthase (glutamine-hydrolysing)
MVLRLLVIEGNTLAGRLRIAKWAGATPAESYAAVLRTIAPAAIVDICMPADGTGPRRSRSPPTTVWGLPVRRSRSTSAKSSRCGRSISFAKCLRWAFRCSARAGGLQLATVAAGGEVALNPAGREVGFARKITLSPAGRKHPMHATRDVVFDAPAIHSDIVTRLPQGSIVTAYNAMSEVQAAEIRLGRGVFWGVQYHPEYGLHDVAAVIRRYGQTLLAEGLFSDTAELERHAADLSTLTANEQRRDIAWRLGFGDDIMKQNVRQAELSNWIASLVQT